jgi:hypothetical protein
MKKMIWLALVALFAWIPAFAGAPVDPDADYDRLDGTGTSGKTVNVIEWEGNLEIHVYPKGSLVGLALKLDDRNSAKPVMVIGYRFDVAPKQTLVRRAILGIDLRGGFRTYRDTTAMEYDKIVITKNQLQSSELVAFRLDPEPKQLYPDGHPALAQGDTGRTPASGSRLKNARPQGGDPGKDSNQPKKDPPAEGDGDDGRVRADDGSIQPFFTRPTTNQHSRQDRRAQPAEEQDY